MSSDRTYFHIISTGTSILSNFNKYSRDDPEIGALIRRYGVDRWASLKPGDRLEKDVEAAIASGHPVHSALLDFVKKDPRSASAELNSFLKFIDKYGQPKDRIEIALYSTQTPNNRLTAKIIYEYLRGEGFYLVGEPIAIEGFQYGEIYFDTAMVEILDKIVGMIHRKIMQGYDVYINGTAGFKPETSFIIIASMIAVKSPLTIYYIHETHREPVILPALPITIESKYLEIIKNYMEPKPYNIVYKELDEKGINLDHLIEIGLIEEEKGRVKTRKWINHLIKLYLFV